MRQFLARLAGRGGFVPPQPSLPEHKASRVAAMAVLSQGRAAWMPRDYASLAKSGFQRNPIAHRAVRLIAETASCAPLTLKAAGRELTEHPLLDLLRRPNPRCGGQSFLEAVYGHLLVAGNAYLECVAIDGAPRELYALRPDRMRVVPGRDGWPEAYEYDAGGQKLRIPAGGEGVSPILHLTLFNPLDDIYGHAPMDAALTALDIHHSAAAWNKALLDNAARPSGALVYAAQGQSMTDGQFERLKAELEASFQGAANAGRPLLLDGGLDWKPLSLSPKDMDFIEAKAAAAREIALALGVPPLLLGLPGDNTHANYAEASRAFWRQTIIPAIRRTMGEICLWLSPAYGDDLVLEPDLDAVEALASERESLWRRVTAAPFLSDDEKREAVGYGIAPTRTGGTDP